MIRAGESISMTVKKCKYQSNSGSKMFIVKALTLAPSLDSNNYSNLKMMEVIRSGLHRDRPTPCLERTSKISAPLKFSTSCSSNPGSNLPSHEQRSTLMPKSEKSNECSWMQVLRWLHRGLQKPSVTTALRQDITSTLTGVSYKHSNQLVPGEKKIEIKITDVSTKMPNFT